MAISTWESGGTWMTITSTGTNTTNTFPVVFSPQPPSPPVKEVPVTLRSALDTAVIAPTDEETEAILGRWAGDPRIARVYDAMLAGRKVIDVRQAVAHSRSHAGMVRATFQNCAPLTVAPLGAKRLTAERLGSSFVLEAQVVRVGRGIRRERPYSMQYVPSCGSHINEMASTVVATTTLIPEVPPDLIDPKVNPDDYLVFFEAHWSEPTPVPADPALLKRLSGFAYEVVAVWDLSPLEAAALG